MKTMFGIFIVLTIQFSLMLSHDPIEEPKVSSYAFAEKLRNPCALANSSSSSFSNESERLAAQRTILTGFNNQTRILLARALSVFSTTVLCDCQFIHLPVIGEIPIASEIRGNDTLQVLSYFYPSLLNHTAYVYFMAEQLQKYPSNLACNTSSNQVTVQLVQNLGFSMRELTCLLKLSIQVLQTEENESFFEQMTSQIMNEEMPDLPMCSRRAIRDCQVVSSSVKLIAEMTSYLESTTLLNGEGSA